MSAVNATVQALLASSGISSVVGTKVNPIVAPQTQAMPNIVVNLVADLEVQNLFDRSRFAQSRVSIEVRSSTATQALALGEAVKNALERVSGVFAGCSASFRAEGTDVTDYSEDVSVKRRTLDFYVWWRVAA